MGQPRRATPAHFFLLICLTALGLFSCDKRVLVPATQPASDAAVAPVVSKQPASNPDRPPDNTKIASLVPAATDLIVGMGAGDHLVAVSNYDAARSGDRELPRVGDYQSTDWEMLSFLKPTAIIIQMSRERMPAGFARKAESLGIRLVNIRLNNLADIIEGARLLGRECGEAEKGDILSNRLSLRIEALRKRSATRSPVKTLLTLDPHGEALVGPDNFLDDLLTAAGGLNAAAPLGAPYPTADHEMLLKLAPDAVLLLRPDARPDALEEAKQFWTRMTGVPAGNTGRVYLIKHPGVLLPGAHVADVAEEIFRDLHGNKEDAK